MENKRLTLMKQYAYTIRQFVLWSGIAVIGLMMTLGGPSAAAAQQQPPVSGIKNRPTSVQKAPEPERFVSIDFSDVDISVFIKFISELTGSNFVVDHRVKGKVTIISPTRISVKEAYKVFESVLEVHGYAAVEAGEIVKIIPKPDARTKNIETLLKESSRRPEDRVVTRLIPLTYADPEELKRLFAPFISKSSVMLAYPPTNMLIVTDVSSNIDRLLRIIKVIDVTGIGQEISVIPLEYSDATDLVKVLTTVFAPSNAAKKGTQTPEIKFTADERTNVIVLKAGNTDTLRVKALIDMLDKETPRGKEKVRVYYLENATAEDLAKVLQELPTKKSNSEKGKPTAPVVSANVRITADKATNSLIIMAEKEDYLVIEEVIKKLDIPRSMVYIESLIMEVNVDKTFDVGTEWTALGQATYENRNAVVGGGFVPGETGFSSLAGESPSVPRPSGFSLGVFSEVLKIGDLTFNNLSAMIQAYKKDKDIHILSTPQVLTTDNEEATIIVGKNIPFQTRSAAESASETYSSFEYKDVGITLKITPHITKDRFVRLSISQEVSSLESINDDRPTTLKRTVETTVIVQDKNTVVIGGLIDDTFSDIQNTVPCLGTIPIMGWAFKSVSKSDQKTNLFVFLTPHVIKNPTEAQAIYEKKKDQIEKIKEGRIKMYPENLPGGNEPIPADEPAAQ